MSPAARGPPQASIINGRKGKSGGKASSGSGSGSGAGSTGAVAAAPAVGPKPCVPEPSASICACVLTVLCTRCCYLLRTSIADIVRTFDAERLA